MTNPEQYPSRPVGLLPNSRFPLLVHRAAVRDSGGLGGGEEAVRARFRQNGWLNNWRYPGIYTYPHFHSTTHECLGCAAGWMELELFGRGGMRIRVAAGDIVVMPAGVSHQMVDASPDIMMVGGYPDGREWDNMEEEKITPEAFNAAAKRIMMLPIPAKDPATGGPMREWIDAPSSVDAGWNDYRDGLG